MLKENHAKITKELCEENTLVFRPLAPSDAMMIHWALKDMGIPLADRNTDLNYEDGRQCIDKGMFVINGMIHIDLPHDTKLQNLLEASPSLLCTAEQLETDYKAPPTDPKWEAENPPALQKFQDWFWGIPDEEEDLFMSSLLLPFNRLIQQPAASRDKEQNLQLRWGKLQQQCNKEKKARPVDEELLKEALQELDGIIGQDKAKQDIREGVALARLNMIEQKMGIADGEPPSRNTVFTGPPGTCKTTFAGVLAKIYYALGYTDRPEALETGRQDFVGEVIGETEAKTTALIEAALGGILFIDEAYSLALPDDSGRDFGQKAVNILNDAMEKLRGNLTVIVAGYPEQMDEFLASNPGLASRFITYISFGDYDMDDLSKILNLMLEQRGCTMEPDAHKEAIRKLEENKEQRESRGKAFGNGRMVRNLVDKLKPIRALDMFDKGLLDEEHGGLSDDDYTRKIKTYTLADVEKVKLEGIEIPKKSTRVGFGGTASRRPQPARAG